MRLLTLSAAVPADAPVRPSTYGARRRLEHRELYDLDRDIGESIDGTAQHPAVAHRLLALAEQAREELGDSLTGRTGKGVREPGRVGESHSSKQ